MAIGGGRWLIEAFRVEVESTAAWKRAMRSPSFESELREREELIEAFAERHPETTLVRTKHFGVFGSNFLAIPDYGPDGITEAYECVTCPTYSETDDPRPIWLRLAGDWARQLGETLLRVKAPSPLGNGSQKV